MSAQVGPLILVVDPDDSLRELFRDLFLLEGYAVDAQPELLPGNLRKISPTAVIYGLGFGNEDAQVASLRSLLDDRPDGCVTVVCTADPAQIARYRAELGSLGIPIVSKPFDIDELLGIIHDKVGAVPSSNGRMDGSTSSRPAISGGANRPLASRSRRRQSLRCAPGPGWLRTSWRSHRRQLV